MTDYIRLLIAVISGFFVLAGSCISHAETPPPRPGSKQDAQAYEAQLKETRAEEEALDEKVRDIEAELKSARDESVSLAKSVQKNEAALGKLEARMAELEKERLDIRKSLEGDQKAMAKLVMALQRLRRVPPEALFAKPGAPLEAAQSALLLGEIIPALDNQASDLKEKLVRLKNLSKEMQADKEKLVATADKLKSEEKELAKTLKNRESIYARTSEDLKTKQLEVKQISAKAQNLKDLVGRLQKDREEKKTAALRQQREQNTSSVRNAVYDPGPLTPLPPSGEAQLPVSGIIKTRFREIDAIGAESQGISITGRGGGLVVAPMAGQVRFAGAFKKYGNIVIIEHQGGYHSLIAGLEKIDTVVERNVSAGEPIGTLKKYGQRWETQPILRTAP
ncbi:MAG: peptidoglycan DD-metalloendopeptidase family protein [Alphaproteobacteria bacterium]|nr:peptidoglycan DD-metalloendopeptidase family protein [Alphaproteobacteria bacterium]